MKAKERDAARAFRKKGWSVRGIAQKLNCSKGSVSVWVRDIPLTTDQIKKLKLAQDRGRERAALHPNSSRLRWAAFRQRIINEFKKEIPPKCSLENLKLIGSALYWAEGYTATRNLFVFANCDADMIRLMIRFLKNICKVPMHKLRGRVNIHPSLNKEIAHRYWVKISGIPIKQFHKPLLSVSRASKQKRKTLPYGTFRIIISDVVLCSKIKGWIEGLRSWAVSSVG